MEVTLKIKTSHSKIFIKDPLSVRNLIQKDIASLCPGPRSSYGEKFYSDSKKNSKNKQKYNKLHVI